ncbi:MAG TPA: hypothetical protein VGM10_18430 [Actinocrinis sp.]
MPIEGTRLSASRLEPVHIGAFAGGTATKLLLATGIAGALLFTVSLLSLMKRSAQERTPQKAPERLQKVPHDEASAARASESAAPSATTAADAFPPQPYSEQEPDSHRPYSRAYEIPRQSEGGKAATNGNGSRPHGSNDLPPAGIPTTPWRPPKDDG